MASEAGNKQAPSISRSVTLNFIGDWGQANFHRICSWLSQEFNDRCGPRSRTGIWTCRAGGVEALHLVHDGEAQVSIATPAGLMKNALVGTGMFTRAMPDLRALAVLPQDDRMVLAIHPKWGIKTFDELRQKKPPLSIATSTDDGTSFIGHVAMRFMEAHGISAETLRSWGGEYVTAYRPEQSIFRAQREEVDALLQEAIMTPWWTEVIDGVGYIPIPAEPTALEKLSRELQLEPGELPPGYWEILNTTLPALDFSDFLVLVRDDLLDDIAYLLTWILVETRGVIEAQYKHINPAKCPLSYPLVPAKMASTSVPLHPAAARCYRDLGVIS